MWKAWTQWHVLVIPALLVESRKMRRYKDHLQLHGELEVNVDYIRKTNKPKPTWKGLKVYLIDEVFV